MASRYAEVMARLSAADHEAIRRNVAAAPPFDAQTAAFLRSILAPAAQRVIEQRAKTTAA